MEQVDMKMHGHEEDPFKNLWAKIKSQNLILNY